MLQETGSFLPKQKGLLGPSTLLGSVFDLERLCALCRYAHEVVQALPIYLIS